MPMSAKRKAPVKLAAPVVKAAASTRTHTTIDESKTSVSGTTNAPQSSQAEAIVISSDEGDDDDDDEEDQDENDEAAEADKASGDAARPEAAQPQTMAQQVNGNPPAGEESEAEPTSPSFGDLLRGSETIDVASFAQQADAAVARHPPAAVVPPSHKSLITVLSQALRSDDNDLLESCLRTKDTVTIQNTIERIDSPLAGMLLTKLAARMHRRPGRAGDLMNWVLWVLVAHGGALASQPQVLQGLSSLQKVLADRTKGLNSLLALSGKLDLLEGQMDLRQRMQRGASSLRLVDDDGDDDEEDVIWVEGETAGASGGTRRIRNDDVAAAANGIVFGLDDDDSHDSDSDGSQADDLAAQDFVLNEAVEDELANDIWDADQEGRTNYEDEDDKNKDGQDGDAEAAAPPSKAPKLSKSSRPRRS
ncbi:U3 small nucleolar RNA-associated protein 5 [Ophiocordyceps camponoti-floridani]|uniref:U3 small nucleolar RNA-associated protein 5 n=1 Tax=Ophiocordyceps camponoti-floridani TaxID=2030778 RepID=A0A8H4Q581_9HYPO|nr:U3 small nucleolar RNA-associated protein 5 [Ophiocordyceps camponoti-floridani]